MFQFDVKIKTANHSQYTAVKNILFGLDYVADEITWEATNLETGRTGAVCGKLKNK